MKPQKSIQEPDDTFDVGDGGTPVSPTHKLPSKFTGVLKTVTVEVKS